MCQHFGAVLCVCVRLRDLDACLADGALQAIHRNVAEVPGKNVLRVVESEQFQHLVTRAVIAFHRKDLTLQLLQFERETLKQGVGRELALLGDGDVRRWARLGVRERAAGAAQLVEDGFAGHSGWLLAVSD